MANSKSRTSMPLSWLVIISLFFQTIVAENKNTSDSLNLEFVSVLFRHGDRTPVKPYPNDPYKDPSNWPVGFGELTNKGKMMQYHLGQYLKKHYGKFIGDPKIDTIYIRSTNYDRTLMSAESNLAGFFPPSSKNKWNPKLNWQPFPIHTVAADNDNLIGSKPICPKMYKLIDEVKASKEIQDMIKRNQWVFDYVTKHCGREIADFDDMNYIYDTLFIEELYNKTLPDWTKKVYPNHMKKFSDLSFKLKTWTPELARLSSGLLIGDLVSTFKNVRGNQTKLKLKMYSGHDTTISSLLNSIKLFDPPIAPPYAAALIFELFSDEKNNFFVKLLYRNDTTVHPYILTIPGCEKPLCRLEVLEQLSKKLIPDDWDQECQVKVLSETAAFLPLLIISSLISVMLFTIIVFLIIRNCCCRNKKGYGYIKNSSFDA